MATIRSKLKEKLACVTSSAHEEITPGSRIQHDNLVKDLTNQLREYFNPFIDAPARHFKKVEIEPDGIKGLLNSQETGGESYKTSTNETIKRTDEKKIASLNQYNVTTLQLVSRRKKNSKEH